MGGYRQLPIVPYQPSDPLENIGRFASLRGLANQNVLQQQAITAGDQENQLRAQKISDQRTIMEALKRHNGNMSTALPELSGSVSPDTYMGLVQHDAQTRQELAKADNETLALRQRQNDAMADLAKQAGKLPEQQYVALWPEIVARAKQIKPDAPLNPAQPMPQQALPTMTLIYETQDHYIKGEQERRSALKAPYEQQKVEADASTAQSQAEIKSRELRGTNLQGINAQQQQELDISRKRLAMESRRMSLDYLNAGFTSDGQPMTASNASPTAKQIASGKMDPATARAILRRQPGLYNQVLAIDPNFDETTIDRRFSFNKELTNYSQQHIGGQSLALNKLVHHSDLLYDLIDGLQNGSLVPGNQLFNAVKTAFGAAPVPKFNIVRDFVAGEAGKLATGGVPNETDLKRSIENMKSAGSPDQLKQAVNEYLAIAGGQMQAINEQGRQNGMGEQFSVLGPEAKAIVQKHGIDPNTLKVQGGTSGPQQAGAPKVGDIVTVKGQKVKITAIDAQGNAQGVPAP